MLQNLVLVKSFHVFGVVLFLGNIVVTAFWKVFADLTHDKRIIKYAQKLVTYTDLYFTAPGILIITTTGIYMLLSNNYGHYLQMSSIKWGLICFIASGMIWISILVPTQIRLHRMTNTFGENESIPDLYWRYEKCWMLFGSIATILPLITLFLMTFNPI
jgi:uncharacterized membrane protein